MRGTIARNKRLQLKKKKTVSSQGQHWFIHKTSLSEQKDDEAENRLTLTSQLFLGLYCTPSEWPLQPLYPSCFEKLAGRNLNKALVAMSWTDRFSLGLRYRNGKQGFNPVLWSIWNWAGRERRLKMGVNENSSGESVLLAVRMPCCSHQESSSTSLVSGVQRPQNN